MFPVSTGTLTARDHEVPQGHNPHVFGHMTPPSVICQCPSEHVAVEVMQTVSASPGGWIEKSPAHLHLWVIILINPTRRLTSSCRYNRPEIYPTSPHYITTRVSSTQPTL